MSRILLVVLFGFLCTTYSKGQFIEVHVHESGSDKAMRFDYAFLLDARDSTVVSFSKSEYDGRILFELQKPLIGKEDSQFFVYLWMPFVDDTLFQFDYLPGRKYSIEYTIPTKKKLFTVYVRQDGVYSLIQNDGNLFYLEKKILAINEIAKSQCEIRNQEAQLQHQIWMDAYELEKQSWSDDSADYLYPPVSPPGLELELPREIQFFFQFPQAQTSSFFEHLVNYPKQPLNSLFEKEKDWTLSLRFYTNIYPRNEIDSLKISQNGKLIGDANQVLESLKANNFLGWQGLYLNGYEYSLNDGCWYNIEFKFEKNQSRKN